MVPAQVNLRALQRAIEIVGGPDELAKRIGVPGAALLLWLAAEQETPPEVFLRVVDIIVEFDIQAIKGAHQKKEA